MALFSYFDDSADPRRERYFAAGGLIGSDKQWDWFDLLWLSATHELKEPFRATECECGHGQFKDWPVPKRNALMAALVDVIRQCKLSAFASIVPVADYRAVFADCNEYDPYYLAVRHTVINMAHIGDQTGDDIKLWFEESETTSGSTLRIYQGLKAVKDWKEGRRLRGVNFDGKQLCPLQGADLVAREAFKHIDNLGKRKTRKPVERMSARLAFILWNTDTLTHLKEQGGPEDLTLLTSWGSKGKSPQMTVFYRNF